MHIAQHLLLLLGDGVYMYITNLVHYIKRIGCKQAWANIYNKFFVKLKYLQLRIFNVQIFLTQLFSKFACLCLDVSRNNYALQIENLPATNIAFKTYTLLQRGSEYQNGPELEWFKLVQMMNFPEFECHLKTGLIF